MGFPIYTTSSGVSPSSYGTIIYIGQVVVQIQPGVFILYTSSVAATYPGYQIGVALNNCVPGNPISVQMFGQVPQDFFTVGAGSESTVVVGGTGAMSRGTNGFIIGTCDPAGVVTVFPTRISSQYGIIHTQASFGTPTTGQSPVLDNTGKFIFSTVLQPTSVSGTGLWHSTGGTLDPAAYIGAADTLLVTNHAGTATAWIVPGGDVTYASNNFTVTGLLAHALPSLSVGYLQWNGSNWVIGAGGSVVTWASDLAGSTNSNQYVAAISGNAGAGGSIPVNATALSFAAGQASPSITQSNSGSGVGGQTLTVKAQSPVSGAAVGGNLNLVSGAGSGGSNDGNIVFGIGGTTQAITITGANTPAGEGTMTWSAALTPQIAQANESSATQGTNFTVAPQQSGHATDGGGGSWVVALQTPYGAGAEAYSIVSRGGTNQVYIGAPGGAPSIYLGSTTPSSTNYAMTLVGGVTLNVNASTAVNLQAGAATSVSVVAGSAKFAVPVQGLAVPFSWLQSAVSIAGGGTITLNATQGSCPNLVLSGAASAVGQLLVFPAATGSEWIIDCQAVTGLGTNTILCKVGSGTRKFTLNAASVYRIYSDGANSTWGLTLS